MKLLSLILCVAMSHAALATTLGLKNFRELPASYNEVTGIPLNNPQVDIVLKKVLSQLPLKGVVEEMSSPLILSVTELAGTFCAEMLAVESPKSPAERKLFRDVDFKMGPKQFTPAVTSAVLNELANAFWGRDVEATEMTAFQAIITETLDGASPTSATETLNLSKVLCSTFGTSLEFLVD